VIIVNTYRQVGESQYRKPETIQQLLHYTLQATPALCVRSSTMRLGSKSIRWASLSLGVASWCGWDWWRGVDMMINFWKLPRLFNNRDWVSWRCIREMRLCAVPQPVYMCNLALVAIGKFHSDCTLDGSHCPSSFPPRVRLSGSRNGEPDCVTHCKGRSC